MLALLVVPAGCGRGGPPGLPTGKGGGGDLRVILPAEPQTLNPNSPTDEVALLLGPNLYNRLLALDADSQLIPDLAENVRITVCRKEVTGLPQAEARGLVPVHDYSLVRMEGR